MRWVRARVLPLAGILCLVGQGFLLLAASSAAEAPALRWPALYGLLAVGTAGILAACEPTAAGLERRVVRRFWRGSSLLAAAVLLVVGAAFFLLRERAEAPAADHSAALDETVAMVARLSPALDQWWAEAAPGLRRLAADPGDSSDAAGEPGREERQAPARGGELFRRLAPLPALWSASGLPIRLGVVLWHQDDRLAWAGAVEPLARGSWQDATPAASSWARQLVRGRNGWILRAAIRLAPDRILAVQFPLTSGTTNEIVPGVEMVVGAISDPALTIDDSGLVIRQVGFGPAGEGPYAHLLARPELPAARLNEVKARWLLVALLAWTVALLGLARMHFGVAAALTALWVGRALWAGAEALRWLGVAYPDQVLPAAPGSWFSLVDPAYFATTFAGGWFASTADAMLTAAVVALTVWYLLGRGGLLWTRPAAEPGESVRPRRAGVWTRCLVFGLLGGAVLRALAFLARLIAENANPRLIGTGVNLDFLSFWGLQIVLMILAFALISVVVGLVAGLRWPQPGRRLRWLIAGLLAGGIAALVAGAHALTGPVRLLAGGLVSGLWLLAPALGARPHFLRRFAWPAIMLLATCWNYASLRTVYEEAERSWLDLKGRQITTADPDWSRYLLGTVLDDMVEEERRLDERPAAGNLWDDERAWRLYRDSALSDLGYKCAVELMDSQEQDVSYFALGFLNTPSFEVISRGEWTDMSGRPTAALSGMIFRTERRRYAGGEEEVLVAEVERAGGRGWLRLELPVRSWRVATLSETLLSEAAYRLGRYHPRAEVDRPVLLMLADDGGWLDTGPSGLPETASDGDVADLRAGRREWAEIGVDGSRWLCLWRPLPGAVARSAGEGFLLGLRRATWRDNVLDASRLMLLDLALFFGLFLGIQAWRLLVAGRRLRSWTWRPGFQESFLTGYLTLGLVLLVLVGMTVDQVGYERVQAEARTRTGGGLARAVEQLRALLTEQAWSLANSDYLDDLMRGRLAGQRPVSSDDYRQGMVFTAAGELLLDETLSDLSADEARSLLQAARTSPMVVERDHDDLFIGTVIPIDLGDWYEAPADSGAGGGHSQDRFNGLFFYRQQLDESLVASLAELVGGQIILDVAGQPLLASHPAAVFAGTVPLLANPDKMIPVLDHRLGASVFAAPGRPFAFTAGRPLIELERDRTGRLVVNPQPAVLNLAFPDREREYANQRQQTVLFLAGLANLILVTALLLALLMSWHVFRPLQLLLTATRSLAQGDFRAPLPEAGRDEVGRLAAAFGSMRTDLQETRDDLAAREEFLATVLARVTVGVAVVDGSDQVVVLNPAGEQILAEFWPEVAGPARVADLLREFRALGRTRDRSAGELVNGDRRRTVRGALAPLELPGGRTDTMIVFEDITEFLTTKKMAINAELARQVAHEIKNPLTPIQLSVQLLGKAWQDRHPRLDRIVPDTVQRVLQQVDLLRSIASEFSLLGRPGELVATSLDLPEMVNDVTGAYAAGPDPDPAEPAVMIEDAAVPPVSAHGDSLRKILGNLMQNSLDAVRPATPLRVRVGWRVGPQNVTMVWRDNGAGLPAEVADRLFDPYFSTKSKGTGLGLVICRNLADRMQGSITLGNRTDGPGAVAELTLPRADNV